MTGNGHASCHQYRASRRVDGQRRELVNGAIYINDNVIEKVGTTDDLQGLDPDSTLDLAGHLVIPGMVNTHHHMRQNITGLMVQDDELLVRLRALHLVWAKLDDEAIQVSAKVAMAELIQSGCTTSSGHLSVLPNNAPLDSAIQAADEIGLRFHAAREAMSRGESQGGLPPDSCVETEAAILKDAERLIDACHEGGQDLPNCDAFAASRSSPSQPQPHVA